MSMSIKKKNMNLGQGTEKSKSPDTRQNVEGKNDNLNLIQGVKKKYQGVSRMYGTS